jgi:hypothetical protein
LAVQTVTTAPRHPGVVLTRASDGRYARRAALDATQRLADGVGCLWCNTRSVLRSLGETFQKWPAEAPVPCLHQVQDLADDLRALLAGEPGERPLCAACLRARRRGVAALGEDNPPPNAPCPRHALCAPCAAKRRW